MKFNKGSELDKQIYKEGDLSWGLKFGFLDVEDVKEAIEELKKEICYLDQLIEPRIDKIFGEKLI